MDAEIALGLKLYGRHLFMPPVEEITALLSLIQATDTQMMNNEYESILDCMVDANKMSKAALEELFANKDPRLIIHGAPVLPFFDEVDVVDVDDSRLLVFMTWYEPSHEILYGPCSDITLFTELQLWDSLKARFPTMPEKEVIATFLQELLGLEVHLNDLGSESMLQFGVVDFHQSMQELYMQRLVRELTDEFRVVAIEGGFIVYMCWGNWREREYKKFDNKKHSH